MGACCSATETQQQLTPQQREEKTLRGIFDRFDKDKSGYISKDNLQQIIQDDKTFKNADVEHILDKFGQNGKMTFEQFKFWWNSTYTTYNDDNIRQIMDELDAEGIASDTAGIEPSPPRSGLERKKRKSEVRLEESRS